MNNLPGLLLELEEEETMDQQTFISEFKKRGLTHRLWQHPYFNHIKKNSSLEDLRKWAIQAGRIDQVFAEILENMLKNPAIPSTDHPPLQENLNDELGHGDPAKEHFTLFQNVLNALKVTTKEYGQALITPGTKVIIETLRNASLDDDNPLRILALMASEELICPHEFPLLLAQLRKYGTAEELVYFDVHIQADVKHADDLIALCYSTAIKTRQLLRNVFVWQDEDLENNYAFYSDLL